MKKIFKLLITMMVFLGLTACSAGVQDDGTETDHVNNQNPGDALGNNNNIESIQVEPVEETHSKVYEPSPDNEYIVIDTCCGQIKGVKKDGYLLFRGIRYATAERWEEAVPVTKWEGVYDATKFGDWSCQFSGFFGVQDSPINKFYYDEANFHYKTTFSEDCLNLNIWTPENAENCPVLVFIHGGAFLTGGNSDTYIDGEAYTKRGVIVVSINYRLGPFASVYGDGYEGNLALTDQITALKWIHDNIADYGGNPNRITIMGESAGAISVQDILISPLAEGLVSGAIMMSGGGDLTTLGTPTSPERIEAIWTHIKKNAGVNDISELKSLTSLQVYSAWLKACGELPQYASTAANPIVDGRVIPMTVKEATKNGLAMDVPCIVGVLSEDMYPHTLYVAAMEFGVNQYKAGKAPVYSYFFNRYLPGKNDFGAFHAADLWYAFGTLDRNWRPFDDIDYRISENMIDYFTNFVKTGNPNGEGLPEWKPITEDYQMSLLFGDEEPSMYEPSLEQLRKTQAERPAFPYK